MVWLVWLGLICAVTGGGLFAYGMRHNLPWAIGIPSLAAVLCVMVVFLIFSEKPTGQPSRKLGKLEGESGTVEPENPYPFALANSQPGNGYAAMDLLPRINPAATRVTGNWTMQDGALLSSWGAPATMFVPIELPRKYQLTAVVERLEGSDSISFGLTVGGRDVTACFDGYGQGIAGLNLIGQSTCDRNESKRVGPFIKDRQPTTIVCTVGDNSVKAICDNRVAIDWQGDTNQLNLDRRWPNGPPGFLHIVTWNTRFRISKLELKPLP